MRKVMIVLSFLLLGLAIVGVAGAVTIDTTHDWGGSTGASGFGYPNTATYGEVVTSPGGSLQSFTFFMKQRNFTFKGYVYAWDGFKATGDAIWQSAPMRTEGLGKFEAITFTPGGVNTTAGTQYILFASISEYYSADSDTANQGTWGTINSTASYPSTYFAFYNNGGDFNALTTNNWSSVRWSTKNALAFRAEFVPIPGTVWLLGSGLLGLAGLRGRRFLRKRS